jgi:hypothetical protein
MFKWSHIVTLFYIIIILERVASKKLDVKKCCPFNDLYNISSKTCAPNHKNFKSHTDLGKFNYKSKMCDGEFVHDFEDYKINEEFGNLVGVKNETDKIYFDFCVDVDSENGQSVAILCDNERTIRKCCPGGTMIHRSGSIFQCKPSSDPVILEDILNQVEEKPNIRILYSEHQVFFRRNRKFTSFDQLKKFDCVDKFSNSWVLFSRIQRPVPPCVIIFSIFIIILFILAWPIENNLLKIAKVVI